MFIIGITGGTGTGKTAALMVLKSLGALTLNCDAIYHGLLLRDAVLTTELGTRFVGVLAGGTIDRKRLGDIVFNDPEALLDLNAITHKYVDAEVERQIAGWAASGGKAAAIDAIALIESGAFKKCDAVVGFTAPVDLRISRIMKRDGITPEQARMRINAQKPDSFYRENCDYFLENNHKSPAVFKKKCKAFFEGLLQENNAYSP